MYDAFILQNMRSDSPLKGALHKSILKSEAVSPATDGSKRVHFLENDEAGTASNNTVPTGIEADEPADTEEKSMEQLMTAAETVAETVPDDKDSSTITIFNENSEVCSLLICPRIDVSYNSRRLDYLL